MAKLEQANAVTGQAPPGSDISTAELVRNASEQISRLVRDEMRLARMELTAKTRRVGVGAALLSVAGVLGVYAMTAVLVGIGLAIAEGVPGWAAALILAGGLLLFAGIFALGGLGALRRAGPPMPAEAMDSVRHDIETVTTAVNRGRR